MEAGARVTLVTGPVHLPTPDRVQRVDVVSARDMLAACEAAMPCDLLIASAAVADYRPEVVAAHKLKKDPTSGEGLLLQLVRNPDILATLAQREDRPFSVGFAAETENLLDYAARKLKDKNLDLIVANDVANPDRLQQRRERDHGDRPRPASEHLRPDQQGQDRSPADRLHRRPPQPAMSY